jgi:signal transduction histidine kinase
MRVNPLHSVGARLSLALLLVVAGSLALVYLVVIPSLQSRLIEGKIAQLRRERTTLIRRYHEDVGSGLVFVDDAASIVNARVALYRIFSQKPAFTISPIQDSSGYRLSTDIQRDPIALRSAATRAYQHGMVERGGTHYAEVAFPAPDGYTIFVSAPLGDTLGAVGVARERLLIAGGIALALALAVGYFAAWLFAGRIRRLERAAERIASGRFDDPIVDRGHDEIGELARAFDRMRLRLSQLDRARNEFIANASHELRTPLFSLGGFLELMDDHDLDATTREEFLATMRDQVKRLSKLAAELLDLSRLDAGHIDLEREPVPLASMARLVADEFGPFARQSEHELAVEADGDVFAVADEQRVVQIIRNLVENALVHTPPGTRVVLRVAREGTAGSVTVEDDGPGIPPDELAHVFERFYRGDGSQASGSGLGLSIALELARVMGGTLELESGRARTAFRLTLPTTDLMDDAEAPRLEPVEAS